MFVTAGLGKNSKLFHSVENPFENKKQEGFLFLLKQKLISKLLKK
jgi:hypothetical protein